MILKHKAGKEAGFPRTCGPGDPIRLSEAANKEQGLGRDRRWHRRPGRARQGG